MSALTSQLSQPYLSLSPAYYIRSSGLACGGSSAISVNYLQILSPSSFDHQLLRRSYHSSQRSETCFLCMMTTLPPPKMIPLPNSRSTTPTPPFFLDDPETPTTKRQRSDTMMTTSSSSSSSHLQTPETPSILGLMHQHFESPGDMTELHRGRKNSYDYDFGRILDIGATGDTSDKFGIRRESEVSEMSIEMRVPTGGEDEVEGVVTTQSTRSTTPAHNGYLYNAPLTVGTIGSPRSTPSLLPNLAHPDPSPTAPTTSDGFPFPPVPSEQRLGVAEPDRPDHKRTKSSFKNAVRNKLERSKSSFKAFRDRRSEKTEDGMEGELEGSSSSSTTAQPEDGVIHIIRPKRSRLRSLLSISMSRSQSSASIRSITSSSSNTTSRSGVFQAEPLADAPTIQTVPSDPSILIRDFAVTPSATSDLSNKTIETFRSRASSLSRQVNADDLAGAIILPSKSKGKARARSPVRRSSRPNLFSSTSSGIAVTKTSPVPIAAPIRISRPRATSMPLDSHTLRLTSSPSLPLKGKIDMFGTLLPRELKVMIFRKLVEVSSETGGNGKWDGEAGGYRQLIKLTRVSSFFSLTVVETDGNRYQSLGSLSAWMGSSGHCSAWLLSHSTFTPRPLVASSQTPSPSSPPSRSAAWTISLDRISFSHFRHKALVSAIFPISIYAAANALLPMTLSLSFKALQISKPPI